MKTSYAIVGVGLTLMLAACSIALAKTSLFSSWHISPLILGIVLSVIVASVLRGLGATIIDKCKSGVDFSGKKLLRLGIILYGFFVSLADIQSVGFAGFGLAFGIVAGVLIVGFIIGVKIFRLDRELAILMSAGCAICGAAAVLALESALRASAQKSAIAIGSVVVFGLLGMFCYPILFSAGLLPLSQTQMGLYTGATLYEVANVVGASDALSQDAASIALIEKMLRVALLAPVLLLVPLFFAKSSHAKKQIYIPYFALGFVAVVALHSLVALPLWLITSAKVLCGICLSMAMCALGLQISPKQFANAGSKGVLWFGVFLFVFVSVGGFALTLALTRAFA